MPELNTELEDQYFEEHRPEDYIDTTNDIPSPIDLSRSREIAKKMVLGTYSIYLRRDIISALQTIPWATTKETLVVQIKPKRFSLPTELLQDEPRHIQDYVRKTLKLEGDGWVKEINPAEIPITFSPFLQMIIDEFDEKGWRIEVFESKLRISCKEAEESDGTRRGNG